nr:response regulator [Rhizobium sp. Q54]
MFSILTVLAVSDDEFVSQSVKAAWWNFRVRLLGPTSFSSFALEFDRDSIHGVVLDVSAADEPLLKAVEILERLSLPFVFARAPTLFQWEGGFVMGSEARFIDEIVSALAGTDAGEVTN